MSNIIDKITDKDTGESRIISPAAEDVRVDNENFEGDTLEDVLDEIAEGLDDAGSGGYTPPEGGIPKTDLAPAVQQTLDNVANKVDKVTGYGLSKNDYTDTDKAKVNNLKTVATTGSYNDLTDKPTIPTVPTMDSQPTAGNTTHMVSSDGVATALAAKQNTLTFDNVPTANSNNPVKSKGVKQAIDEKLSQVTVNAIPAGSVAVINDLVTDSDTDPLSAAMGKELNDRLEAVEESGGGLSYTEDATTIYVTTSGYVDTTPRITASPTEISLSPAVGGTVTKNIVIVGKNLTNPITIALTDASGFYSLNTQSLPATGGTLVLTYHPTATGMHNASLLISSTGAESVSVAVAGVASQPTITVDKQSLTMKSPSGSPATATIRVSGTSLTNDISIAVSGSGFSVSPSTIAVADAAGGVDVAVTFDGSAESGSATITISSSGAESVQVAVTYATASRLPAGSTIDKPGMRFTVLTDTSTVSVKDNPNSKASGALVIPATVQDDNGVSYTVTTIEYEAWRNNTNITSVELPASITTFATGTGTNAGYSRAFRGCTGLVSATIRGTAECYSEGFMACTSLSDVTIEEGVQILHASFFEGCTAMEELVIPNTVRWMEVGCFAGSGLKRLQLGTSSECRLGGIDGSLYGYANGTAKSAAALEYIICYASIVVGAGNTYSQMAFGGGLPPGFRNYNESVPQTGSTLDKNGTGRVYVLSTMLDAYRTNATDGSSNPKTNIWKRCNTDNGNGSNGRIYSIENIGTIIGYETDALLTSND